MSPTLHANLLSVFGWVIRGSFMAGILVLLVLIVQFLLKNKLEARWKYLIWLPVAIRLLLPWAPESSLSLYNVLSLEAIAPGIHQKTQDPTEWKGVGRSGEAAVDGERYLKPETSGTSEIAALSPESGTVQTHGIWWNQIKQLGFTNGLMLVWLAGVLFFAAKTVYDQIRLKQALRAGRSIDTPFLSAVFQDTKQLFGIKRKVRFVASEQIPGPAVVGFREPAIVIAPSLLVTLQKDQLQYILAHEFSHIQRRDVAVNWMMHMILILHWFNPLIWIAAHKARQAQEMACDACALDRMRPQQKNAYGQTIIHVLEHLSVSHYQPGLAGLSATHKEMKRRLIMIKQFNKKSYRLSILGLGMILALGSVTLVNAKESGAESASQKPSVQSQQNAKAAVDKEDDIVYPEGNIDRELYKKELEKARKKAEEAAKALTPEEKKYIEDETNRVKELSKKTGDMYVLYHKYKDLNSGLDLSYLGGLEEFSNYEDYLKKASDLEGSILKQPANLPEGYKFSKARIEGPTEGKFVDEVRAEGKKSGKPIYAKKIDWKEAATIRLEYTNGKNTLAISKYTLDAEGSKKQGFFEDDLPAQIYPKYVFWHEGGFEYSISTTWDMSKEKKIEILKAAVKK
ncbi:M56 family metallopeptidase [Paenibacillus azoreducens]|uniref:Methicillin resistance mecR1 protein n=1 Tax=Paenibacillus azoreducens TaxID=116718 RepID=A0A920CV51_9BACL|nr:M56 family metallopeptidase [Paenibacillus azoreducens]GIO51039.1 methicillin resistance mecR1 protein [Paenibacillus azoreducens]